MTGRQTGGKVDPSFKSKRYRDKLRTEVKSLENLLPVDRPALHRKLDSQTVYRLVIAYLRIKAYFRVHSAQRRHAVTCAKQNGDDEAARGGSNIDVKEDIAAPTRNDKKGETSKTEVERLEKWLKSSNILQQILDGFLLVLSADGTILYVSENVLQYLGFNQVDLMHRCIYGSVHPDDQLQLRSHLEPKPADTDQDSNQDGRPEVPDGAEGDSAAVAVMCRMSCFTGNTTGYTKLHCTGKSENVRQMPRTPRTSDRIVLLYCQPFMINAGSDVTPELRRDVFWSKHDLDMKFKDIDKKAEKLVGYRCGDLQGRSFYDLVHPEDLFTCVNVHRSLSDSTEVRSMYFRLQNKDGGWMWCHSRGKVISKNSKKFSIVFTHCPIRDEDSVFIQHETATRQRYSLADLVRMNQYTLIGDGMFPPGNREYSQQNNPHTFVSDNQSRGPLSEPMTGVVTCDVTNNDRCPSTWHALGDRHSPVLPSSHVAHKLTQRDKQLQFAEFKRKHQTEKHSQGIHSKHGSSGHVAYTPTTYGNAMPVAEPIYDNFPPPPYVLAIGQQQCYQQLQSNQPEYIIHSDPHTMYNDTGLHFHPAYYDWTNDIVYPNIIQSQVFNFPPSPPPSPNPRLQKFTRKRKIADRDAFDDVILDETEGNTRQIKKEPNSPEVTSHADCVYKTQVRNSLQSRTDITMPLQDTIASIPERVYEGILPLHQRLVPNQASNNYIDHFDTFTATMLPANHFDSLNLAANERKVGQPNSQSCAVSRRCCHIQDTAVNYDTDTSIHMTIVENVPLPTSASRPEVDIPSIGSFLEYLNENQ